MTREQAQSEIRDLGGNISSSVSSSTNYLIIGNNPGNKLEKAKKLGTKIISEKEFIEICS